MLFFLLFSREEISPGRLSVVGPGVITSAADDSRPASASSPALSRLAFVRETGERGKRQSGPNYYFLWAQDVSSTSSQRIPPLWRYSGTCQRPDGKTLSTFPFSCWCSGLLPPGRWSDEMLSDGVHARLREMEDCARLVKTHAGRFQVYSVPGGK